MGRCITIRNDVRAKWVRALSMEWGEAIVGLPEKEESDLRIVRERCSRADTQQRFIELSRVSESAIHFDFGGHEYFHN